MTLILTLKYMSSLNTHMLKYSIREQAASALLYTRWTFTASLAAVPEEFHVSIIALALATRNGDWLLKHLDVQGAGDYTVFPPADMFWVQWQ